MNAINLTISYCSIDKMNDTVSFTFWLLDRGILLSNNFLTGSLPEELGRLTNLRYDVVLSECSCFLPGANLDQLQQLSTQPRLER